MLFKDIFFWSELKYIKNEQSFVAVLVDKSI